MFHHFRYTLFAVALCAFAQAEAPLHARPDVAGDFGHVAEALRGPYTVVLRPDEDKPEWWAGAPSVVRAKDGSFWMACRMRRGDGQRGLRGYELRILKSADGERFDVAQRIAREDVPIPGFERPALVQDPVSGAFKLYACGPWKDGPWCILKFDDTATPGAFAPASARPVITPRAKAFERDLPPVEYKDPVIVYAQGAYHAYVIGYTRQNERIFHFSSADGETWAPVDNPYAPLMPLSGWHDFFVRPASVLPLGVGYLFVYEGSSLTWRDPVYNIATGLGFTYDLHRIIDLSPASPVAVSNTPSEHFATFRYSSWLQVGAEIWVYAEAACPNDTHEIRLFKIKP
jgi:hypothetical protein